MGLGSRLRRLVSRIRDSLPYLAGALALTAGIFCWVTARQALEYSTEVRPLMLASEDWPVVQGRIVGHSVQQEVSGRFSHMPVTHYYARPRYVFEVNGLRYANDAVCPEGGNCGRDDDEAGAQALLAGYPVGMTVPVSHHPDLTPAMAQDEDAVWSLLQPGYRPWIEAAIRANWTWAACSGLAFVLLCVFVVRTAPEFRSAANDSMDSN